MKISNNSDSYISATNVRKDFFNICKSVRESGSPVKIKTTGEALVLISEDTYDDMLETISMLSDAQFMKDLKAGLEEFEQGKMLDWENVKKDLLL